MILLKRVHFRIIFTVKISKMNVSIANAILLYIPLDCSSSMIGKCRPNINMAFFPIMWIM